MRLKVLGDDLVEQSVNGTSDSSDEVQDLCAVCFFAQRSLYSPDLTTDAAYPSDEIGSGACKVGHTPSPYLGVGKAATLIGC